MSSCIAVCVHYRATSNHESDSGSMSSRSALSLVSLGSQLKRSKKSVIMWSCDHVIMWSCDHVIVWQKLFAGGGFWGVESKEGFGKWGFLARTIGWRMGWYGALGNQVCGTQHRFRNGVRWRLGNEVYPCTSVFYPRHTLFSLLYTQVLSYAKCTVLFKKCIAVKTHTYRWTHASTCTLGCLHVLHAHERHAD